MRALLLTLLTCFFLCNLASAQKGSTAFGLQYKPIVPNRLIGTFEQEFNDPPFYSTVKQKFGHALSMLIRVGLSDRISLETGLGITQRNFDLNYSVPDSGHYANNDVRILSYSLPISCLVFIRLGEQWYMNTALGAAMTVFPSDVRTYVAVGSNKRFQQEGAYRSKVQGAALANIGWEYRTRSKGTWYLGAAYHLPFIPIMTFAMSYEYDNSNLVAIDNIRGSYLTLDLRYYFNEKKEDK
ncbi:MAG: hypothetical protein HUJ25_08490 [Crocinitomicaceae bacterium]|nr:hypothetical protein [Crocinitomicaceae bacterium]